MVMGLFLYSGRYPYKLMAKFFLVKRGSSENPMATVDTLESVGC